MIIFLITVRIAFIGLSSVGLSETIKINPPPVKAPAQTNVLGTTRTDLGHSITSNSDSSTKTTTSSINLKQVKRLQDDCGAGADFKINRTLCSRAKGFKFPAVTFHHIPFYRAYDDCSLIELICHIID